MSGHRRLGMAIAASVSFLLALVGCGGGNSNPPPPPPVFAITTGSILAATLQGTAYTTTLSAINGQGALHWSMSKVSATTLFPDGLTIDANTGVISGTANFGGTAAFIAQVTDSASPPHSASQSFTVTAYMRLTAGSDQTFTIGEFANPWGTSVSVQGGVPPLSFRVTSGSLPPGLHLNSVSGQITGTAYADGAYQCTVAVQDSYSPAELASKLVTFTVTRLPLSVANSIPARLLLNRPFSGSIIANGGTPPYSFALYGGSLPAGLGAIDPSSGQISGTPTTAGYFSFGVKVTDSSSPAQAAFNSFNGTVAAPVGRNDSPATATVWNNSDYSFKSISPYVDPPETSVAGDNDYYSVKVAGGITLHAETWAKRNNSNNPLDTVLEIVDGNGVRLTNCRQPGDTSTNFTSPCINDDISLSPQHVQDSALDYQIPSTPNGPQTVYLHVLDWRGDARPDMAYNLVVSGAIDPLSINVPANAAVVLGLNIPIYSSRTGGYGNVSWSVLSGSLPPGMAIDPATGTIGGVPTSTGTYTAAIQAADSLTPPQTASASIAISVVQPLQITSTSPLPDANLGMPYSYNFQATGGSGAYSWWLTSAQPFMPGLQVDRSGTLTVTPTQTGTFTIGIGVSDPNPGQTVFKNFSLTVK